MTGYAFEPRNLVERAADAALHAATGELAAAGAAAARVLVLVQADDVPAGEPTAATAGHGELEDGRDVIAMLLEHAVEAGRELGLDVKIAPIHRG